MVNFTSQPITERIARIRERFRSTKPKVDINRYKIVTEFYQNNPDITGIFKRAYVLKEICEKMPTPVWDDELIVGCAANTYRGCVIQPENSLAWFKQENPTIEHLTTLRTTDPYLCDPEDFEYIYNTVDFWAKNSMCAMIDHYLPEKFLKNYTASRVLNFQPVGSNHMPVGHFIPNFQKLVDRGLGSIKEEALMKMEALENIGMPLDGARKYTFYRAVVIVIDALIHYTKRYAIAVAKKAQECTDPVRKAELEQMAVSLDWIIENPARTYQEALQAVYLYHMGFILDAQTHGNSFGRLDITVGKYAEADIAAGRLTLEQAQELTDSFMLKVAEINKFTSELVARSGPGYTTGSLVTVGGVDKQGNDSTNISTFMILESTRRLKIHQPPVAIRVHDKTPDELWKTAIACNRAVGGLPSFQYDGVIIKMLAERRGLAMEDARNYALAGCVEPAGNGCDFANSGGDGNNAYTMLPNALLCAINNGVNPFKLPFPGAPDPCVAAPQTGYLYEMNTMQEVLEAYETQIEFFTRWQVNMVNSWENLYAFHTPLPLLSATMDGCMESGLDIMWGGAKYNGAGNSSIGHGTVADSLNIINQLCFEDKICTTRELYDAIMNNWEGHEDLLQYIRGRAVHFGNDDPKADQFLKFVADTYSNGITRGVSPRGCHWSAGCWPVTLNVAFGMFTHATPDGRKTGEPLSDGISPVQSMDKNGPLTTFNSILKFDQCNYANGTLCNMKFHPTVLAGEDGWKKLRDVMLTYFQRGGMELQLNLISSDTLRDAQKNPEEYKDLVVRIAGFSAYFVEVYKESQDDLIRRTEMSM